jgi:hypothetical protein
MPKSSIKSEVTGIRLSPLTKQDVAKRAAILGVPTSSFIRVLVRIGLDQVDKDPSILLKNSEKIGLSSS